MKTNFPMRKILSVLILSSCSTLLAIGCGESEDNTTATGKTTAGTPANRGYTPPVITVDLVKFAKDFG
ncbi:MAG: hypothetical protein O2875_01860, partial [Planctomycetota bacterium]|nr:hypothetical protein [Planctomycetota bacterium]